MEGLRCSVDDKEKQELTTQGEGKAGEIHKRAASGDQAAVLH